LPLWFAHGPREDCWLSGCLVGKRRLILDSYKLSMWRYRDGFVRGAMLCWLSYLPASISPNAAGRDLLASRFSACQRQGCPGSPSLLLSPSVFLAEKFIGEIMLRRRRFVCLSENDQYNVNEVSYWLVKPGCTAVSSVFNVGTDLVVTC